MTADSNSPHKRPDDLNQAPNAQEAAELIRQKVANLYENEPDAEQEIAEAKAAPHRSKHQQFMYDLSTSGKDLATVQTEWHNYYQSLAANEQHQVWQEFYSSQSMITSQANIAQVSRNPQPQTIAKHKAQARKPHKANVSTTEPKPRKIREARSKAEIQEAIKHKVSAGGKLEAKHHIQSLLFGLGMGAVVLVVFLFGFFNEVIVAPFIQPSRTAASTPLIVSDDSISAKTTPEVIIPKINVQIPAVYDAKSIREDDVQAALERGVVHYPTTSMPGQNGNAAFFGHSSNNIFNKGQYKFAFVLLHMLENGDTFYLTNEGKVYAYKVFSKKIVEPNEVGVLDPIPGKTATATLITCDPPGTSLRRLVVVGEQISPDPANNKPASETTSANSLAQAETEAVGSSILPGNGPMLLTRYLRTPIGKLIVVALIVTILIFVARQLNKSRE